MKLNEALTKIANGARFTRDSYGWHIVRKADASGNHHHHKIKTQTARALIKLGHNPELLFNTQP